MLSVFVYYFPWHPHTRSDLLVLLLLVSAVSSHHIPFVSICCSRRSVCTLQIPAALHHVVLQKSSNPRTRGQLDLGTLFISSSRNNRDWDRKTGACARSRTCGNNGSSVGASSLTFAFGCNSSSLLSPAASSRWWW
jgi:hypothetical protein